VKEVTPVDPTRLAGSLLNVVNDGTSVTPYGHGWLLTTPMRFYDEDRVTLFVEPFEQGFRVTDQGTTAMRLVMADVSMDSARVLDAWRRSIASLSEYSMGSEAGVISACGAEGDLGVLTLRVAEAMMRVDQLRWLTQDRRPARFTDRLVSHLRSVVSRPDAVTPRAALKLSSGRIRQVTAAIGDNENDRLYIQAVTNGPKETRDRSVEHCAYLFNFAPQIAKERRVVVASGGREEWPSDVIAELSQVSDVAFFDERTSMDRLITARADAVLSAI
jgi:hypothetical protein